jgi:hypothetical protein
MFLTAAAVVLLVAPSFGAAQAVRTAPAVGVTVGVLEFDLSGVATRAARAGWPPSIWPRT